MKKYEGILICSDYDDTLAYKRVVSRENIEAINRFCEEGGKFTVISGRQFEFMREFGKDIKINAPFAGLNGSFIWNFETGEPIHGVPLDNCELHTALEYFKSQPRLTHLVIFAENEVARIMRNEETYKIEVFNAKDELVDMIFSQNPCVAPDGKGSDIQTLNTFLQNKIYKFIFGTNPKTEAPDYILTHAKKLLSLFEDRLVSSRAWPYSVEMQSKEATKGKAIKFIKKHVGAKVSIGIGNYENDMTMIEDADIGVAVANSCQSLIDAADFVVAPCQENSLKDLIDKLDEILADK